MDMYTLMLTPEHLQDLGLHYNAGTGVFTKQVVVKGGLTVEEEQKPAKSRKYIRITIDGVTHPAANLAWLYTTGQYPGTYCVDHRDGDPTNNRFSNLRPASRLHNSKNKKLSKCNTSGLPGVRYIPKNNRWNVTIGHNGKTTYLGSYDNLFDAACARKSAEAHLGFHPNHGKR